MSSPPAAAPPPNQRRPLRERLFEPVDIASIAVFRVGFGLILFWEVWRFFDQAWVKHWYIDQPFHFTYFGFSWVKPWPGDGMSVHFAVTGAAALGVASGLFYRVSSWVLFLGYAFWFLLDEARYLNHLYLVVLLTLLMALIPAHRARSLDARRKPALRADTVPAWCLFVLRAQLAIVYVYAAVAKLNPDWLAGEPMRRWLAARNDYPLIGPWFGTESAVWCFSYGGVLFDLLIVPAIMWRPTRSLALVSMILFHVTNTMLFDIGIFPVTMIAATLLFLPPDWPRRALLLFGPLDGPPRAPAAPRAGRGLVLGCLGVYLAIQLLLPLRHLAYRGSVHWTEEGHRFAWHMKLREKRAESRFFAEDPVSGDIWEIDKSDYLDERQADLVGRWPDMSLQFAHFLADELEAEGHGRLEIHVEARASLNGRPWQDLLDVHRDLAAEERVLWPPADWILPLTVPLPGPEAAAATPDGDH